MSYKTWKENRKLKRTMRKCKKEAKKDIKDPYLILERQLLEKCAKADKGSEEFEKYQNELKSVNIMRAESRESKRCISKADKGAIIRRAGEGFIGLFGLGTIYFMERNGFMASGEKRTIFSSIARGFGDLLGGFLKRG